MLSIDVNKLTSEQIKGHIWNELENIVISQKKLISILANINDEQEVTIKALEKKVKTLEKTSII
jgi:hypothetical protein